MSFCVSMPHFTDIGSLTAYPGVRDNRSTINTKTGYDDHGRDMTSYRLSRCGRCGSPILGYVWFCIWWCYSHQNPKSTKYYWHISIYGWDITTSGLETQMSATLELYFRFRFTSAFDFDYITAIGMLFCISYADFHPNWTPTAEIWRHINLSRWRP